MAEKKFNVVYIDRLTGKTVSKRKWSSNKNKRYGGGFRGEKGTKRYVKKKFKVPERDKGGIPPEEIFEWIVNFSYEKSGRSFDVVVTARDENEAYGVALEFLRGDIQAQRIVRSKMRGWMPSVARGKKSNEEAGNAVYRNDSDEEA